MPGHGPGEKVVPKPDRKSVWRRSVLSIRLTRAGFVERTSAIRRLEAILP
jgi:hypothetical protein